MKKNDKYNQKRGKTILFYIVCILFLICSVVTAILMSVSQNGLAFLSGLCGVVSFCFLFPLSRGAIFDKDNSESINTTNSIYISSPTLPDSSSTAEKQTTFHLEFNSNTVPVTIDYVLDENKELFENLISFYYHAISKYVQALEYECGESGIICDIIDGYCPLAFTVLRKDSLSNEMFRRDGFTPYRQISQLSIDLTEVLYSTIMEDLESKFNQKSESFIVYIIIRNGMIRYYNSIYVATLGYDTIEELCENGFNDKKSIELYTLHYMFENDIFSSICETYNRIKRAAEDISKNQNLSKIKSLLFSHDVSNETEEITLSSANNTDFEPITAQDVIYKIDLMSGAEFERFIADFFKKQGYNASITPISGDYGIDVIIETDFIKIGIQTKCYRDKVPNSAVQEAVTGLRHYKLDKAMVITNSYFQPSAITLAKENNVILWNRDKLIEEIIKTL